MSGPPSIPGRLESNESGDRTRELEAHRAAQKGCTGILHITAHPHGYDIQTTLVELGAGDVWVSSSSEFGGAGWRSIPEFPFTLAGCLEQLRGEGPRRTGERAGYGRFITIYCVTPAGTEVANVPGLLTTTPIVDEFDRFLAAVTFMPGKSTRPSTPHGSRAALNGRMIELVQADITKQRVDAIVTAANRLLCGGNQAGFGGGVDGAVHRAAGPTLLEACLAIGGCATGEAVATHAGALSAKRVIHAVGPIYGDHAGREDELLERVHRRSLDVAAAEGCESVALPAISCGVYRFPVARAAPIALRAVRDALLAGGPVRLVRFCLFTPEHLAEFQLALGALAARDPRVVLG